jgi:hypothetical protein
MRVLRYTLVSEGSSDRVLLPILRWLFDQHLEGFVLDGRWADPAEFTAEGHKLPEKIPAALLRYPCDVVFVHRDADDTDARPRYTEIQMAMKSLPDQPFVCIVPVQEIEAWLVLNEGAIRSAAGNPGGSTKLSLPSKSRIERTAQPKELLKALLREAAPRKPRFSVGEMVTRIPDFIEDFAFLRGLSAFDQLEQDIAEFTRVYREQEYSWSSQAI